MTTERRSLDPATMLAEIAEDEFDGVFDYLHELNGISYRLVRHGDSSALVEICGVSRVVFYAEGKVVEVSSTGKFSLSTVKQYGFRWGAEFLADSKELVYA